jgi:hypothetical protein
MGLAQADGEALFVALTRNQIDWDFEPAQAFLSAKHCYCTAAGTMFLVNAACKNSIALPPISNKIL